MAKAKTPTPAAVDLALQIVTMVPDTCVSGTSLSRLRYDAINVLQTALKDPEYQGHPKPEITQQDLTEAVLQTVERVLSAQKGGLDGGDNDDPSAETV